MNRLVNVGKLFFDSAAGLSHGWMSFLYEISYRMMSKICNCLEIPLSTVSLRMGFLSSLDRHETDAPLKVTVLNTVWGSISWYP